MRTLFLYRTVVALTAPFNPVILGSQITVFDTAALRVEFTLGTNRLTLVDINLKRVGIVRPLMRIGARWSSLFVPLALRCAR